MKAPAPGGSAASLAWSPSVSEPMDDQRALRAKLEHTQAQLSEAREELGRLREEQERLRASEAYAQEELSRALKATASSEETQKALQQAVFALTQKHSQHPLVPSLSPRQEKLQKWKDRFWVVGWPLALLAWMWMNRK